MKGVVFFDVDDTLLNHTRALEMAALQFGNLFQDRLPCGGAEFIALWRAAAQKHMSLFECGQITFAEQRRRRIREIFDSELDDDEADRLFAIYARFYEQNWAAFPDVLPCLERLAGMRLGIISNGGAAQQRHKLAVIGVASRFETIVTPEAVGIGKPDPRIFQAACARVDVDPAQCLYVGDLLDLDARAAQAAGFTGIWLNRGGIMPDDPGVITIHDLRSLPELLLDA